MQLAIAFIALIYVYSYITKIWLYPCVLGTHVSLGNALVVPGIHSEFMALEY